MRIASWLIWAFALFGQTALAQVKESPAELMTKATGCRTQLEGKAALSGVQNPDKIQRDRWGIPHIYAKNAHVFFFTQVFVAAQDRFFQIVFGRRQPAGKRPEVFGPDYIPAD